MNNTEEIIRLATPEVLKQLQIKDDEWDVLIFGDGSGSRYGYAGGWGSVVIDKVNKPKILYGAISDTTVNVCELSPYVYSLLWYSRNAGKALQAHRTNLLNFGINIHLITDCRIIAEQGNKLVVRDTNLPLWLAIDCYERYGYKLKYHWIERDTVEMNNVCDRLSKDLRLFVQNIELKLDTANIVDTLTDKELEAAKC